MRWSAWLSLGASDGRRQQIDILKGLAAISVVYLHSVSAAFLVRSWSVMFPWRAVSLFVLLMGTVAVMSSDATRPLSFDNYRRIVTRRVRRLLLPFAMVWLASLALGLARDQVSVGWETALLALPGPGTGAYFVMVAVTLAAMAPVIVRLFVRYPWATTLGATAVGVAFELGVALGPWDVDPWFYATFPLRYLPVYVYGMWLVPERNILRSRPGLRVIVPYALLSGAFLIAWNLLSQDGTWYPPPLRPPAWPTHNVLGYGWVVLIGTVGLTYLPDKVSSPVPQALAAIGRASYHVFLVQMIWVVLWPSEDLWRILPNVLASCLLGYAWYSMEYRFLQGGSDSCRKTQDSLAA